MRNHALVLKSISIEKAVEGERMGGSPILRERILKMICNAPSLHKCDAIVLKNVEGHSLRVVVGAHMYAACDTSADTLFCIVKTENNLCLQIDESKFVPCEAVL